jgi:hypothetical protein
MSKLPEYSMAGLVEKFMYVKEGYESRSKSGSDSDSDNGSLLGGLLIIGLLLFLTIGIWIWGLVVLIKYWKHLPAWAKALGVIGLLPILPLGPVVTLICVYVSKGQGSGKGSSGSSSRSSGSVTPAAVSD